MDNLWAPWRAKYILKGKKEKSCLLCKIAKSRQDKAHYVIMRTSAVISIMNIYPYNNGHILVVPKRHINSMEKINDAEWQEMRYHINKLIASLKRVLQPDGFNIGINLGKTAGAGIDKHIHIHIVPRWQGDTNFMPVIAKTKVISQSLKELYKMLTKEVEKQR